MIENRLLTWKERHINEGNYFPVNSQKGSALLLRVKGHTKGNIYMVKYPSQETPNAKW